MNNSKNNQKKKVSYRELIAPKSQNEQLKEELDLKVTESKASLEVTIATTKKDLAGAKRRLDSAKSAYPYSVKNEMNAAEEVEQLERGLKFAEAVLEERF